MNMGSKRSSRKRKQDVLQKKEEQLKTKKRPNSSASQLQADSALLQQTLGNEAVGQLAGNGHDVAVQKKENEREKGSTQAGIQQILNRKVGGQAPSIQRLFGRSKGKLKGAEAVANPVGAQADQTSAAFESRASTASKDEAAALNGSKTNLDIVAGGADTLAGLQSLSQSWQDYKAGKLDKGGMLEGAEGAAKVIAGSAKVVDSSAKAGGSEKGVGASDMAGKATGLIGDTISTVKEAFTLFKDGWSQFKQAKKLKKVGAQQAGQLMLTASKGIQAGFKMAKGWYDVLGSKVPADVLSGIPVMGIIINGLDIMLRGYDFYKAYKSEMALKDLGAQAGGEEEGLRRELIKIGVKREKRAGSDITRGLMSIVGDIMNLSGAGIAAGVGMKMTAGASGAVQTGARGLKQWTRDKAAGGSSWALAISNPMKSTDAKADKRSHHSAVILDMLQSVRNFASPYAQKVNAYVEAAGSSFDELGEIGSDPNLSQAEMIDEAQANLSGAMKKR